jgi:methyl-accepting chemotaxis protein
MKSMKTRSFSLQAKVLTLVLGGVLTTSLALLIVVGWSASNLRRELQNQVGTVAQCSTTGLAQSLYQLCAACDERIKQRLVHSTGVAHDELANAGKLSFGSTIAWNAVNQFDHAMHRTELPKLLFGGQWLGQNANADSPSPVVDAVKRYTQDCCTVFQRMNPEGDMLRVCTNILTPKGERAIGTYIPHLHPDGSEDAMIATVLQGKTFVGRKWVVDQWYNTCYEPIWDSDKKQKVEGMLFVGVAETDTTRDLRNCFRATKLGKSGYAFILQGSGSERGKYILSKDGAVDGEIVWNQKDDAGQTFVQSIVNKAMQADAGKAIVERYPWKNPGDAMARSMISSATYYQPWDWVIGVSAPVADYDDLIGAAVDSMSAGTRIALACAVGLALVCGAISAFVARTFSRPIHAVVGFLGRVATGDLREDVPPALCSRGDEVGQLARGLQEMVLGLRTLVGNLTANTGLLSQCAAALSDTARQLANGADQTTQQSNSVATAAEEMSANMNCVAESTEQMSANVRVAASAVDDLTASITQVARNAEQAASVAGAAAGLADDGNARIAELGAAASEIGKVIEVIQDIAEQTSLLALNATIEAARAGDAGKGFAVVATEVKELARQTAAATEDIRCRIEGIQSSTGLAVRSIGEITEVIKKVNDVSRTIAAAVEEQGATTREIARNVAATSTAAQTVARGVVESADVTRIIAKNIVDVDAAARQTAEGAASTRTASIKVNDVTEQIHTLMGQFKTGA